MIRTSLTWVVVGGVLALVVAGAVDALFRSGSSDPASATGAAAAQPSEKDQFSPVGTADTPLPRCTAEQIAVSIEAPGESATIVVRHARGEACHLARLPVRLKIWDPEGRRVRLATIGRSSVFGAFSPDFEDLINITYLPDCDQPGPFLAVVNVGSYVARRSLSANEIGCFPGE